MKRLILRQLKRIFQILKKKKFVQFTLVETDRKGGKYKIVNCYPNKDPKKSVN